MQIEFKAVKRKTQFSFVTPVTEEDIKEFRDTNIIKAKGFSNFRVYISNIDRRVNGSPKIGDMIDINPENLTDQWLISEEIFKNGHDTDIEQSDIQPIIIDLK